MSPKPHIYPEEFPRSSVYRAKVQGEKLDVLHHAGADHTSFECAGQVEIEIEASFAPEKVVIRPLRLGIICEITGPHIRFILPFPQHLQIEIDGQPLLYIYGLPFEKDVPAGDGIRRFESGRIHDVGEIILENNETCWIEAGAIVKGVIRSHNSEAVRIGGYGILDGGYSPNQEPGPRRRAIILDKCKNARVENILMLGPTSWMVVIGGCEHVSVCGVRQIAIDMSSDGIDIVGSRHVRVSGCCLHNGDDNIAIKSFAEWSGTVEDIVVSDCSFYNINGGSAMEIGYETTTEHIRNIRFENIDVLAVHQFGSVFGIHNGDRATVENITWDNIRVEHHFDTLIDFRVLESRWNTDAKRGLVRNVTLRNIRALQSEHNDGYTVSIISGYNADHAISGITFEDFVLGKSRVLNADQLDLVTRNVSDVNFR